MKKIVIWIWLLLSIGLFIYGAALLQERTKPVPLDVVSPTLIIPSLHIQLPIYPAKINGTVWETSSKGISHLDISPMPGEIGNSVLYGHNWPNILGNLKKIKPGEIISIANAQKEVTHFVVIYTLIVEPNDGSVYANTNDTRITIYTCIGLFDDKRFVVVATLMH